MPIKMRELPISERPYEKLEMYGAKNLSNAELLAIIIKTGTKEENSVTIAQKILKLKGVNKPEDLQNIAITEFMSIKGIGKVKAIQLRAVCELAKRMSRPVRRFKSMYKNRRRYCKTFNGRTKIRKKGASKSCYFKF